MIEKISELKSKVNSNEVKQLCENTISMIGSSIYNGVTPEAKLEIERVALSNLFEQLSKYKEVEGVNEWLANQQRLFTIKNLGIREAVYSLNESAELRSILEQFKDALNKGVHEARLYEQFISALSPFGYFPTVGNAVKAIKDRVDLYKNDVDIVKIIETMKETRSNYLVPFIEDNINNYLSNKTAQNKYHLTETLMKFTYDPFVRDIASLLTLDATELQLEYANAQCDIEKVYSPVLYIGENEAVFAVNKVYYVKKGNNVSRLPEVDVMKLDGEFKTLCETLANPNVIVERNGVTVYFGNDKAVINDEGVVVNEQKMTNEQFKNAAEVSQWKGNTGFFSLVEFLRSNFNEISEVDFVKRVYLKENANYGADVFKLRDNVFITLHNPGLGKSTFYRNVNPIQAKNLMMEHLRFDVTSIYQGLLPDEEKINEQIKETKQEYNEYISELQTKIAEFQNNPYAPETTQQVLEALEEELQEVKNEYKDYLNHVEKYMRASEVNEEISIDINVDGKKYTVPIPQEKTGQDTQIQTNDTLSGTEVGKENIEDQPASAITFDDDQTELLGDTPTIPQDQIDLGTEDVEDEAEKAEKEKEEEEEDVEAEGEDVQIEDEVDLDSEDTDELKSDDEEGSETLDDIKIDDEEEDEEGKEKKDDEEPLESSEGQGLEKKKFIKEDDEAPKKKRKVYLKRKVTESVNENLNEHHKKTKASQIGFICKNDKKCKKEDLEKLSDKEVEKKYLALEKKMGIGQTDKKKAKSKVNESFADDLENNFFRVDIENNVYYIYEFPDQSRYVFTEDGMQINDKQFSATYPEFQSNMVPVGFEELPQPIKNHIKKIQSIFSDDFGLGTEEDTQIQKREKTYAEMGRAELNYQLNLALDSGDYNKATEISKYMKESANGLNESAQIGNTVIFDKQKGYVIGQTNDGDLIVQIQGSTHKANQKDVKVVGEKEEAAKVPYKFDKLTLQNLTTKAMFEQFVRCGIFMGNIPVKLNDCFVKYSDWNDASNESQINVLVEGAISILPKSQIKILEDINEFANLENYVEGVEINEETGDAIGNVQINVVDYTQSMGDADPVRIIRGSESGEPVVDTVPKATLRTLAV